MRYATLLSFSLVLAACDDDGASTANDAGTSPDTSAPADLGTPDPDAVEPVPSNVPASGRWAITVTLTEFGGLAVGLELGLTSTAGADGGGTIDQVQLFAVKDDAVSEALSTVTDISVDPAGAFTADFGAFVLPAAFSPTAGDVELELVLSARRTEEGAFCGGVTGAVVTLDTVITESTFGAATEGPAPGACPGGAATMLPRIEDCPTIEPGRVAGFVSGGVERNFELHVPGDHQEGEKLPLVFLHHGVAGEPDPWGNVDSIVDSSEMPALVDTLRFILVVPNSRGLAVEWAQNAEGDNEDLAFFDDAITCLDAQYGVDRDRIYAMGLSGGGIYTTYLALRRADALAAVAAMSPALTIPYADPEPAIPFLVAWGGVADEAFGQDFNANALRLIDTLTSGGHEVVACNHGEEHAWATAGSEWMLRFALDHPRGVTPPPYADGLPDAFPEFCERPE